MTVARRHDLWSLVAPFHSLPPRRIIDSLDGSTTEDFGFAHDELHANRSGSLTAGQRQALAETGGLQVLVNVVALLGGSAVLWLELSGPGEFGLLGLVAGIAAVGGLVGLPYYLIKGRRHKNTATVEHHRGRVVVFGKTDNHPCRLQAGNKRMPIEQALFAKLEKRTRDEFDVFWSKDVHGEPHLLSLGSVPRDDD